jgi:hypothetical protein
VSHELISKLAEHGLLGLLLVGALYVIYSVNGSHSAERTARLEEVKSIKDQHRIEINALQALRLTDAQAYAAKILELNTAVYGTVDKLADVADRFVQITPERKRPHA